MFSSKFDALFHIRPCSPALNLLNSFGKILSLAKVNMNVFCIQKKGHQLQAGHLFHNRLTVHYVLNLDG
ncbi:hypothetical protein Mapa_008738 [Marchantia paleacea]|nr:hypothetical protein Mapa_008738 [Marchantia paleacea]